jgi:hypothetical protein
MKELVAVFLAVLLAAGAAYGGANPEAKLALDCHTRVPGRHCTPTYGSEDEFQQYLGATGYYDVIVVLYDFNEVKGLEFGLDYSEVEDWYFTGFVSCADFLIGGVDQGGMTSVTQTWQDCIELEDLGPGQTALGVGWLMLYGGAGPVRIGPSDLGGFQVLDCHCQLDPIVGMRQGYLGGYEPPVSVEATTWGGVKGLYR